MNGGLHHFHDPRRRIGKAFALVLGAGGALVWDVYLAFHPGSNWEREPPSPADWAHQLHAAWAAPERFRAKEDLEGWLRRAVKPPAPDT